MIMELFACLCFLEMSIYLVCKAFIHELFVESSNLQVS